MSTMSGKNSPEGEEGAGRMKSESWGQSNAAGDVRRGRVILVAYLIVTLELTFLFMQFGVMPVSMGCWAQRFLPLAEVALPGLLCSFSEGFLILRPRWQSLNVRACLKVSHDGPRV